MPCSPCTRPVQDLRGTQACRWPADLARLARRPGLDLRLDSKPWEDRRLVPDWSFEAEEGGPPWEHERQAEWRAAKAAHAAAAALWAQQAGHAEEEAEDAEEEAAAQPLAPLPQAPDNQLEVGGSGRLFWLFSDFARLSCVPASSQPQTSGHRMRTCRSPAVPQMWQLWQAVQELQGQMQGLLAAQAADEEEAGEFDEAAGQD